jgi:hypothetical protein
VIIAWMRVPWTALGMFVPGLRRPRISAQTEREIDEMARSLAWRIRRVFDALAEPGVKEAIAGDFAAIAPAAAVVHGWVELVSKVVRQVEARWGPGTGALKARVAHAAILRMVHDSRIHIEGVPDALEPLAYDYVIRTSIEAIVALYNANDLWAPGVGSGRTMVLAAPVRLWARVRAAIDKWLEGQAWKFILRANRLPPEVEVELVGAVNPAMVEVVRRGFAAALRLTAGIGVSGPFVRAMMEVVSVAVRDAEVMSGWKGSVKRAYATKLLLSMMEEFDWLPQGAWYGGMLEWMLGMAIDITVERLNLEDPSWRRPTEGSVMAVVVAT